MLVVLNHVWLFVPPWTVAIQAPLSMRFSRQEYWNGLPCPTPRDLPDPGIEPKSPVSPALAGRFFTTALAAVSPSWMDHHVRLWALLFAWAFVLWVGEALVAPCILAIALTLNCCCGTREMDLLSSVPAAGLWRRQPQQMIKVRIFFKDADCCPGSCYSCREIIPL